MGVWLGGKGGGCERGYPLPPGVRGLGLWKKVLKISIENLHFKGHVYAVFRLPYVTAFDQVDVKQVTYSNLLLLLKW
jgi:hypothetical protein